MQVDDLRPKQPECGAALEPSDVERNRTLIGESVELPSVIRKTLLLNDLIGH